MTTLEQHAADEARRAEIAENERRFFAELSNPLSHYQHVEEPEALTLAQMQANAEMGRLRSLSTAGGVQRELMRLAEKIAPPSTVSTAPQDADTQFGAVAQQHANIFHMYGEKCFNKMLACMRSSGQHVEAAAAQHEVNDALAIQSLVDQNILEPMPLPQFVLDKLDLDCLLVEGEILAQSMGLKP